jgi:hypothetical protein
MKHSILLSAVLATLALSGCERPSVVEVPGPAVAVQGPAGPAGATIVEVQRHDGDDRRDGREGREERPATVSVGVTAHADEHRAEAVKVEHGNTSVTVENKHDERDSK